MSEKVQVAVSTSGRGVVLGLFMLVLGVGGCTKSPSEEQAERLKTVDPTLSYQVVSEDPDRYVGQTVAWDGISLGTYRGPKDGERPVRENFTYLEASDTSGGVNFDKPFVFHRLEGEDFRTAAAKTADADPNGPRRRLIIGTIVGSEEFRYEENGESHSRTAPVLKDVIVDVRHAR